MCTVVFYRWLEKQKFILIYAGSLFIWTWRDLPIQISCNQLGKLSMKAQWLFLIPFYFVSLYMKTEHVFQTVYVDTFIICFKLLKMTLQRSHKGCILTFHTSFFLFHHNTILTQCTVCSLFGQSPVQAQISVCQVLLDPFIKLLPLFWRKVIFPISYLACNTITS